MNRSNLLSVLALTLLAGLVFSGCKKAPKGVTVIPGTSRPAPGTTTPGGPADPGNALPIGTDPGGTRLATDPTTGGTELPGREDEGNYWVDREMFRDQTVYFDFDSSAIKPSEKGKIDSVASYLKTQGSHRLKVEGHCDERGTEEYNRALGERRALSIREYLIAVGIGAERVSTISYGEDKPAALGHDEASWAKNRRGEFLLLTPKTP